MILNRSEFGTYKHEMLNEMKRNEAAAAAAAVASHVKVVISVT